MDGPAKPIVTWDASIPRHSGAPTANQEPKTSPKTVQDNDVAGPMIKTQPDPRSGVDPNSLEDEDHTNSTMPDILDVKAKKRSRKRRPKSKRGQGKPTGFEDFYADAPVTPEEYEELCELYDPELPFIIRIDEALSRYQSQRRFENDRSSIFVKYLKYGGVNVGPKPFAGVTPQELRDMDKEDAIKARSQTGVPFSQMNLDVDFHEVVRGFLTSFFPAYFHPESLEKIKLATVTIRNFLSYLLYHDVCPEYKENIDKACKACDLATVELWKNQQFVAEGPGSFNQACATLYGGYSFSVPGDGQDWIPERRQPIPDDFARKVVKFALAVCSSRQQMTRFQILESNGTLRGMQIPDINGFEIISIVWPDPEVYACYKGSAPDLIPLGKIQVRSFQDPAKPDFDLSPRERRDWNQGMAPAYEFEFLLETNLLAHCYPGMKVNASVWQLNCGLFYFDAVESAFASFYTVLPNDLMMGWKEPKSLPPKKVDKMQEEESW
ncbi:hypothetical protein NUU61_007828 [Penicillium alfredii]|uniref:Argonaute complex, subunit Arb1 n=1 Tax=Penicillium alfredii TaxID=1506179 RepID=A0A9W9JYX6_9EURO|nr:uncharacterized protein NUU61_007828 [Penicillium alfredii]KAJ5086521.1 hypothetical protein NUU61_007828 [Penicillium alfredii]